MPTIIDCDPGIDDAIALAMALAGNELDVRAITTSYGNVSVSQTTTNAIRVLDWLGSDLPVHAGASRSLLGPAIDAAVYHGATGLGAPDLGKPSRLPDSTAAIRFLIDALSSGGDKITIVALGPLTNIALALRIEPSIADGIERIVIMGGSTDYGNDSPAAEFNFLADPHAAQIVLDSGLPISLFGLNVTHRLIATPERLGRLRAIGTSTSRITADMIAYFEAVYVQRYGFAGAALHDPCTIAYLLEPSMFDMRPMRVDVDTSSGLSLGRAVYDVWGIAGAAPNAEVAVDVDPEAFFDLLDARIAAYPSRSS